jgi:alginate O-acetyltransferase complex protein AlgI
MLFSSPVFCLLFLPATYFLFLIATTSRVRRHVLLIASIAFYGYYRLDYVFLIFVSIVTNYLLGAVVERSSSIAPLAAGIVFNLGLLAFFKYGGFFAATVGIDAAQMSDWAVVILPLGISFFTFEQISYLVDIRRGEIKRGSFFDYSLFVLFFPHLIAGPIIRAREFFPQLAHIDVSRSDTKLNFAIGTALFSIGLFKKAFIADKLGVYADAVYAASTISPGLTLVDGWMGALTYSLQIYFDFSGYSDMAIGIARLFGIILPINFWSPYRATGPIEFWRRWHITLSRFMRDYAYFSFGGSKRGIVRQYFNVLLVMGLVGLWHGAGWQFVLWGMIHGVLIVLNHGWRILRPAHWRRGILRPTLCVFATFLLVTIAWVPFRAPDMNSALEVWRSMAGLNGIVLPEFLERWVFETGVSSWFSGVRFENAPFHSLLELLGVKGGFPLLPFAIFVVFFLPNALQWTGRYRPALRDGFRLDLDVFLPVPKWRPTVPYALFLGLLFAVAFSLQGRPYEFIYFQF